MLKTEEKNYIIDSEEIIGEIQYLHEFYSINLKNERDIIIWLPPSYHFSGKKYPVLYMHDGQNLFDPNTSFIGNDWKVDEVASGLIKDRLIQEIIIIGIYNTKERLNEYNYFHPTGKKYAAFIIKELKPFIDEHYRTTNRTADTAVMGSSMGGLISFQLFWQFPTVFGKAACLSNSFWVNDKKVFEMIKEGKETFSSKNKLYIDCGSEEKELIDDFSRMVKVLKKMNIHELVTFGSYIDNGSRHTENDWAARLYIPLRFLFGNRNDIMT
jgi:predicted alpha/beta superfamily hydrolase